MVFSRGFFLSSERTSSSSKRIWPSRYAAPGALLAATDRIHQEQNSGVQAFMSWNPGD